MPCRPPPWDLTSLAVHRFWGDALCPPRCQLLPAHLVTAPISPLQYRVTVPLMGAMSDLCEALSRLSGIAAENMVVTDVYNHRFHKIFQTEEGLNHIMPRDDIFV